MSQVFANLSTDPTVGAIGLALALAGAGLWLAAAWWTYTDMTRRTSFELVRLAAAGWILISTPLLLPLALAAYVLARPQQTVAERRAQRLFEAMAPELADGACPGCGAVADPSWHRCPSCATWLASTCSACEAWSATDLEVCPFCARDKRSGRMVRDEVLSAPARTPRVEPALRPVVLATAGATGAPPTNREARDPRRARGTGRIAGSSRLGIG
jgi:hypothetical protein